MAKKKNFWGIRMGSLADIGVDFGDVRMRLGNQNTKKKVKNKLRKNKSYRR